MANRIGIVFVVIFIKISLYTYRHFICKTCVSDACDAFQVKGVKTFQSTDVANDKFFQSMCFHV